MGGKGSGGHNRNSRRRSRVRGNAGKRKSQRRRGPAFSGPLGPPPKHFSAPEIDVWRELSAIVPPNVVEASDRWAFELLVCQMLKFRRGRAKSGEVTQIASLLGRLGMTPGDRGRVDPRDPDPQQKKNDPYAKFLPSAGR